MSKESAVSRTSFAKITRPRYAKVLPRPRLFALLEDREHPVIWISAPPGAGKTALLSSYLDAHRVEHLWYQLDRGDADLPTFFHYLRMAADGVRRSRYPLPHLTAEYASDVPTFTRRYFEALTAPIEPPFFLVLDNYHEVPSTAAFHAALRDGVAAMPRGFLTVVLSRSEPPPELARMRLNDQLLLLGWDELRLTPDEVAGIERLHGRSAVSYKELYDRTQGWAGGVVLLLQQDKLADSPHSLQTANHQVLFDYFAGEIFVTLPVQAQRVLAASALLNAMSPRNLVELTGSADAAELIDALSRSNYFTLKHDYAEPIYEYHPLFREFLLERASQTFTADALQDLRRDAARLLEAAGRVEEAAELLQLADDAGGLARLAGCHVAAFVEQGRSRVVEAWLQRLPEEELTADPWLIYWLGICRLPLRPSEARACFERAYALFRSRDNLMGRCRAWCAIVDSFVIEWHDFTPLHGWIAEMSQLLSATPRLPDSGLDASVACAMFVALMYAQPQSPELPRWEERARDIILHGADPRLQLKTGNHLLIYYSWWLGELAKAELLVNMLRPHMQRDSASPLMQTTWYSMAAVFYFKVGDNAESLECTRRGLEIAERSGVHTWDMLLFTQGAFVALSSDDIALADSYVGRMQAALPAAGLSHRARYHYVTAWLQSARGNLPSAAEMLSTALTMLDQSNSPYAVAITRIDLGAVLCRLGQRERGLALIHQARAEGTTMRSKSVEHLASLAEATIAMQSGDDSSCLEHLRRSLAICAEQGSYNHVWWCSKTMSRLYAKALAHGIETDYVICAIGKRNLQPPVDAVTLEFWPWPFKIHTLGAFRIVKNGQLLRITGKSSRKPLELLKAVIAFGGTETNQTSLADALWPDLEGDNAQRAFETALYRLRKFLQDDTAVVLKSGKLSFDRSRLWVDSDEIERLFQQVDVSVRDIETETPRLEELSSRLLAAYAGHFLPEEEGGWAIIRRARLRIRFIHSLQELAGSLEAREAWQAAARCYRRVLEIDPLLENFWYRLMICHEQLQQTAEALTVYRRCRQALSDGLGISPCAETEELRSSLGSGGRGR